MFSKELENLIQATLEDGVLEEYEKTALVKRAQAEGVDLTELEIYINSLLQKRQRELRKRKNEQEEKYRKEKKEAFGRVCPNCGKQVPPMTLRCDCGYEFSSNKQVSSVQILADKIEGIMNERKRDGENEEDFEKHRIEKICDTISLFPVPNTKEDIIEFLSMAAPNSKTKGGLWGTTGGRIVLLIAIDFVVSLLIGFSENKDFFGTFVTSFIVGGFFCGAFGWGIVAFADQGTIRHNKIAHAWRAKFDQVMIKARSLRGDTEFTQQLDYYENLLKK